MTIPSSTYVNRTERWNDQQTQLLDLIHTTLTTISIKPDSVATISVSSVAAGETHIGEVGGNTSIVSVVPVVSLVTYSANDVVGGKITLTDAFRKNGGSGILQSFALHNLTLQTIGMSVFLFHDDPSNGTYTDNSALDIDDLDLFNCLGWVELTPSNYKELSDNCVACTRNLGLPIYNSGGTNTNLWIIIRTEGASKFTTTTDTKFIFGISRD